MPACWLPSEVMQLVVARLPPGHPGLLACTCRAWQPQPDDEPLWRALCVQATGGAAKWLVSSPAQWGSWRAGWLELQAWSAGMRQVMLRLPGLQLFRARSCCRQWQALLSTEGFWAAAFSRRWPHAAAAAKMVVGGETWRVRYKKRHVYFAERQCAETEDALFWQMGGMYASEEEYCRALVVSLKDLTGGVSRFPLVEVETDATGEPLEGKWLRGLNRQGNCYLYIHTHSHEVRGVMPSSWKTDAPDQSVGLLQTDPWLSWPRCQLSEVQEAVAGMQAEGLTPLCVTNGDQALLEQLLAQFAPWVVDTRTFVQGSILTKVKYPDAVEAARRTTVGAMRAGHKLCIDLQDQAPNFEDRICSRRQYNRQIPSQLFSAAAEKSGWQVRSFIGMLGLPIEQAQMFKAAERENGVAKVKPGFAVLMATCCRLSEFEQSIQAQFSKKLWRKIAILRVEDGSMVTSLLRVQLLGGRPSALPLSF